MYKKIVCIAALLLLFTTSIAGATPCNSLVIYGKIYDVHGNPIGGVTVTARDIATNKIITNGTFNVTATDGYQIDLGNLQSCWTVGDTIVLYSEYREGSYAYNNSVTFIIPIDIQQQGDIIHRDLHLTTSNNTTPPPPPPEENRTHYPFPVYGTVTNSVGETIDGANITISNENTGDVLYNTTKDGGQYGVNIGSFEGGWKYNDRIKIVARAGSGNRQEVGSAVFETRIGQTGRQKDIQMAIIQMDFPTTYEGLLNLYFDLFNRYNQSSDSMQILQDQIDYISQQLTQEQQNHSKDNAAYDKKIADLNSDVTDAKNNAGNPIAYYVALVIAIALAIYILLDKIILPWRRGER